MAKKTIEVDRVKLVSAINQAENNGPLKNLDALWTAAAELYSKNAPPVEISKSVVCLRATAWALPIKTTKGRAVGTPLSDEQKAAMQAGRTGPRLSRADKFNADPKVQEGFRIIKEETPERFSGIVQRLTEQGSMKAGMALVCLQCTVFQPGEIRQCQIYNCGAYAFRPYKGDKSGDETDEVDSITDEVEELA